MYENDIRGISSFENFYIIGTSTYENNIQRTSKHVTVFLCTILLLLKLQSIETILFFTVYKAHYQRHEALVMPRMMKYYIILTVESLKLKGQCHEIFCHFFIS